MSRKIPGRLMNVGAGIAVLAVGLFICGGASLRFILRGDDDISDRLRARKPTPDEAIRRITYVLSMLFTAIFGGSVSAILFKIYIILPYYPIQARTMTQNQNSYLIVIFLVVFFILQRGLQNLIRNLQGRKPRPLVDLETIRHNLGIRS